jgi:imidazolonepropionase-like amidohydrolase
MKEDRQAMDIQDSPLARSDRVMDLGAGSALLLRNARILDVQEGTLQPGSVLIENGIIRSIHVGGPQPPVGSHVCVLDLEGRVVMPGLMDLHAHPMGRDINGPFRGSLSIDEGVKLFRAAAGLSRTLEAGFTTIRCVGHGTAEHFEQLKAALALGLIKGPRMLTCGWIISPSGAERYRGLPYEWMEEWKLGAAFADGVDACRQMVRRNFGLGADFIKMYMAAGEGRSRYTLEEVRAITDEAHCSGKRVAADTSGEDNVRRAIEGNVDTIEHGVGATRELLEKMAERGIFLTPTLSVFNHVERMYPPLRAKYDEEGQWKGPGKSFGERQAEMVLVAQAAGVKITCGIDSDCDAGDNAEELVHLVDAGLSPQKAIAAATRVSAEALGLDDRLGQVRQGFLADLVIVNASPLEDIRSLQQPENIWRILRSQAS